MWWHNATWGVILPSRFLFLSFYYHYYYHENIPCCVLWSEDGRGGRWFSYVLPAALLRPTSCFNHLGIVIRFFFLFFGPCISNVCVDGRNFLRRRVSYKITLSSPFVKWLISFILVFFSTSIYCKIPRQVIPSLVCLKINTLSGVKILNSDVH